MHRWYLSRWVAMLFVLLPVAGCREEQQRTTDIAPSMTDDLSAQEILRSALKRYSRTQSYQDNAVLYLTYRLNGRAIHEPHQWSIAWDRNGQFSADWFNAKIRCDGEQFSCYVYDIETGNVDNQQIMVAAKRGMIRNLLDDRIASHFIFGTSELPLDKLETESKNQLVQPILGFYDEQLKRNWLHNASQISRLQDDDSTGRPCYVLRIEDEQKIYRLWIAQESGVIDQVELPIQYLDSEVLSSEEITNLQFFVRFHDAQLDGKVPSNRFDVQQQLAAKPVRNFIALPEPMASALIGERVEEFELFTPDATRVTRGSMSGSLHVLLCIAGFDALEHVRKFAALKEKFKSETPELHVIYSDEFLKSPGTGSFEIADEFRDQFNNSELQFLYDKEMNASASFKLKAVPSVIVLGANGKIEYARALDTDNWDEQLQTAVNRIVAGDAVAQEMKSEYLKYLDEYHEQLAAASTDLNVDGSESVQIRDRKYKAEKVWKIRSLREPGNVHIPAGSNRIYVLDGWQTVVELDMNGEIQNRHRLKLPADTAINRIRSFRNHQGELSFVAFAMLGKQAFVFDDAWKLFLEYPTTGSESVHRGITECQLADTDADGNAELWISFVDENGVQKVDVSAGSTTQISNQPTKSFCLIDGQLIRVVGDEIRLSAENSGLESLSGWRMSMIRPIGGQFVATGRNELNQRKLFKLDLTDKVIWSNYIGAPVNDTDIEPLVIAYHEQHPVIGVASDRGPIIFADDDDRPFEYSMNGTTFDRLTGIGILSERQKNALIITADGAVSMWEFSRDEAVVRPASTARRR